MIGLVVVTVVGWYKEGTGILWFNILVVALLLVFMLLVLFILLKLFSLSTSFSLDNGVCGITSLAYSNFCDNCRVNIVVGIVVGVDVVIVVVAVVVELLLLTLEGVVIIFEIVVGLVWLDVVVVGVVVVSVFFDSAEFGVLALIFRLPDAIRI